MVVLDEPQTALPLISKKIIDGELNHVKITFRIVILNYKLGK